MTKGPKGFSEKEKEALRNRLCTACEQSWAVHGYKKTTVGELTKSIGVATGSFYLLFPSKEEMFAQTFRQVQERLRIKWQQMLDKEPNKEGFKKAMRWLYREYSCYPFLYDFTSPDFMALLNRLPEEVKKEFIVTNHSFFSDTLESAGLTLMIPQEKAFASLSTLLYTVSFADGNAYDHFEIFDFLLENTIDSIFK